MQLGFSDQSRTKSILEFVESIKIRQFKYTLKNYAVAINLRWFGQLSDNVNE